MKETREGYGRNLRGEEIPLPTLARALELGYALHTLTLAGVATATTYASHRDDLTYLEQGSRVASYR